MEPVAFFPEGSTALMHAAILENIQRDGDAAAPQVERDAALAGKIAEGSFGKVFAVAGCARPTVVKQVTPEDARTACNTLKEGILLSVMSAASQDYIPALRDCFLDQGTCSFVMDQAQKSLDAHLPVRGPAFSQHELGVLSVSLLAAVHGLHMAGVLHNDLKPKNLLLAGKPEAPTIQIIDLDAATLLGMPTAAGACARNCNGTTAYLSPERLLTGNCSVQSDMWAVGVILYELLEGRRRYPFNWQGRRMTAAMMEARIGKLATRGTSLPSSLKSGPWGPLLQGLLHKDPARRWGIRECACFPGFQDAFFVEAAARAPPTHAALINQLLVMRKVWQAAATCWQYDGIRQSFCQEVDPWAVHAAPAALPRRKIGECIEDDESDDESQELDPAPGGADICEACPDVLDSSRTVSTIVFSSDDEGDTDGGFSTTDSISVSTTGSISGSLPTISRTAEAINEQAALVAEDGLGTMPPPDGSCGDAMCNAAVAPAGNGGAAVAAVLASPVQAADSCADLQLAGDAAWVCVGSNPSLEQDTLGAAAQGIALSKAPIFSPVQTTPRLSTDDDTKSSFRIAAAWPPGGKAGFAGLLLAADGQAGPGCLASGQSNAPPYGHLLDAYALSKMLIKSTLSDKAIPNHPVLVTAAPDLVMP